MSRTVQILFTAAFLSVFAVAPAYADEGGFIGGLAWGPGPSEIRGGVIVGTVSAVSGSTLSVLAKNGTTLTVDVSGARIERVPNSPITAADIGVGDTILIQGRISDGAVTATRVVDGIPTEAPSMMQRGRDGRVGMSVEAELAPLGIGRMMNDLKERFSDTKPPHSRVQEIAGAVTSVSSAGFTIDLPPRNRQATTTAVVTVDASTTYRKAGATASFADIVAGAFVRAQGSRAASSTLTIHARRIEIASTTPQVLGRSAETPRPLQGIKQQLARRIDEAASATDLRRAITVFLERLGGLFAL